MSEEEQAIRQLPDYSSDLNVEENWSRTIGDGIEGFVSSLTPVYAYDTIYAASREGLVVAMEPDTGDVVWRQNFARTYAESWYEHLLFFLKETESARIAGISVAFNQVFIATENGLVKSLDATTGELLWSTDTGQELLARPAADADIIVVNSSSGTLVGLDSRSGDILWTNQTDVPALTVRGVSAPTVVNGGAVVGTPQGKIRVSVLETGLLAWETALSKPTGATELERIVDVDVQPVVIAGVVYSVAYNGGLSALELRTGRVVWNRDYGGYRNLYADGNQLFLVDKNNYVIAVNRLNGVELWSNQDLTLRTLSAPAATSDHVVVGDKFGVLHFLNRNTGAYVSREALANSEDKSIYATPLTIDDDLVIQTREGRIYSLSGNF